MKNRNHIRHTFVPFFTLLFLFTSSCKKIEDRFTVITLPPIENEEGITQFKAELTGDTPDESGFIYSTDAMPSLENGATKAESNGLVGDLITQVVTLEPGTNYYVRAYVSYKDETLYGNEINFKTNYVLGQDYAGGKIAYFAEPGEAGYIEGEQHGLILSTTIGIAKEWGCLGTEVEATETTYGSGQANTNKILAGCGEANTAAVLCDNYEIEGYTDWYLPSYRELLNIDGNFDKMGGTYTGIYHWTSSQASATKAWAIYLRDDAFLGSAPDTFVKNFEYYVVAVRSF